VCAHPRGRARIFRDRIDRPRAPSSAVAVVALPVGVVGVTDLRRPQTWPVLGHAVTVWLALSEALYKAWVQQPAAAVVGELPDDCPRVVQTSISVLLQLALFPASIIVMVVLLGVLPMAVFEVVPGAKTFVAPVYTLFMAAIFLLSLPACVRDIWPEANTTMFERGGSERISEAQQQYVEGELTEDELEAELEAGFERGNEP